MVYWLATASSTDRSFKSLHRKAYLSPDPDDEHLLGLSAEDISTKIFCTAHKAKTYPNTTGLPEDDHGKCFTSEYVNHERCRILDPRHIGNPVLEKHRVHMAEQRAKLKIVTDWSDDSEVEEEE